MAASRLTMPWEYHVCSGCFRENPYAIWLIKQQCFEPHQHKQHRTSKVVVDETSMAMVRIRPLPANYNQIKGYYILCHHYKQHGYHYDLKCPFAHSDLERNMWNIKKRILENQALVEVIINADIKCQSPSEVCRECFKQYNGAVWLAWLQCAHPERHISDEHRTHTIMVVIRSADASLVEVREVPSQLSAAAVPKLQWFHSSSQSYCKIGNQCWYANSQEELNYWKLQLLYEYLDEGFRAFWVSYDYPTAFIGRSLEDVTLTPGNYKTHYHKLVYLDELAHSRKIIQECDGNVSVSVPWGQQYQGLMHLTGMTSGAIDYAIHNHAEVQFSLGSQNYTATIEGRDDKTDTLHIYNPNFIQDFQRKSQLVSAHFEINHKYFRGLHQAIQNTHYAIIRKLLPNFKSFPSSCQVRLHGSTITNFTLDEEYQIPALEQMLSSNSDAPFLLLGPFGTGKTHLIAAAVVELLEGIQTRVLVCTHQNIGANNVYKNLQKHAPNACHKALRLVPSEKVLQQMDSPDYCRTLQEVNPHQLSRYQVIVTTFSTALRVKEKKGYENLYFTHILIDEGAQSREPEALGALALASDSTKIIIVGDNQQIGPQVAVLSKAARRNGLGTSLIERLYERYKYIRGARKSHSTTLLTNYRSHPSILMLASSLFYECTLLSRSDSTTHPKAPYPVVFACASLDHNPQHFINLPAENEEEAELLVTKTLEFVREWPVKNARSKPTVGLLGSTRKQVAMLRRKFNNKVRNRETLPCKVEILPAYLIQGEEFTAVFLSTCEPTNREGESQDPVRSICNKYVFNTLITRARSLIFTAGNPFLLQFMGTNCDINCWAEYIQRCIQCQTLLLPKTEYDVHQLQSAMQELFNVVFSSEALEQATQLDHKDNTDTIVQRYISDLQKRREYKIATRLVQDRSGHMQWEPDTDQDETQPEAVISCRLEFKNFGHVTAVSTDPTKPEIIELGGLSRPRLAFHGDIVKVDMVNKCMLLDDETEHAVCKTHFGASFLCRANPKNSIMFFPLDKRFPKFVNLPTLTRHENDGVICFDPNSLKNIPKMNNFIPMESAAKMLFIVKFLGWRKRFPYPLGIIVGALPCGDSPLTGDMVLRIAHSIPVTLDKEFSSFNCPTLSSSTTFTDAFTIDPEGSTDHDDALTCKLITKEADNEEYEIGVHITNVHKYISKDSDHDDIAKQRACAAYSNPSNCISKMLPKAIVEATSLLQDEHRDTFSVVAQATFKKGTVHSIHSVAIKETSIKSTLELTYPEAQSIIDIEQHSTIEPSLMDKIVQYNDSYGHKALTIEKRIQILWKIASFLRYQRLGQGAYCFPINEPGQDQHPEAHYLVEELMIWANTKVARELLDTFPDSAIIRTQTEPNKMWLETLIEDYGTSMATSLALQQYIPKEHPQCTEVQILLTTLKKIQETLRAGHIKKALHLFQFEHLHPQLAVAHSCFRKIQSPSHYQVSTEQEEDYWHDTLRCNSYTHFTSPIRRFIDIAVQRMLHAALNGQSNPYTTEELEAICISSKEAAKRANNYEREMKRLHLASDFQQSSKEFTIFVTKIEKGVLYFCYPDLSLKKLYSQSMIYLKNLNATRILQLEELSPKVASVERKAEAEAIKEMSPQPTSSEMQASWTAKVSSISGTPQPFLESFLLNDKSTVVKQTAEINLLVPETDGEAILDSPLVPKKLSVNILPHTYNIPLEAWSKAQAWLEVDPQSLNPVHMLRDVCSRNSAGPSQVTGKRPLTHYKSPLWTYKLHRPIQPYEVMKVQLCASSTRESMILTPRVQLLEVAPNLRVCIQHNQYPVECFSEKPTQNASKKTYKGIKSYFNEWERVLIAEAAYNSLNDSELLFVRDVTLTWPKLAKQINSSGQVYYQLPMQKYVSMELPKRFMNSSYEFFKFKRGDLVCVRYDTGDIKCVFHMVVHDVIREEEEEPIPEDEVSKATVDLKFIGRSSNYISHKVNKFLSVSKAQHCEVQLIPLSLPYRRIYKSLFELQKYSTDLAKCIALGEARAQNIASCRVSVLPQEEASIATSLWPLQTRPDGTGRIELNVFQKKAIDITFSSRFSMIQGPPGTGKSVTGAHLAYALAMKMRQALNAAKGKHCQDSETSPCVLYCGPSQHSVDVVLAILTCHNSPVRESPLKIIRVYSRDIERSDFAGWKQNSDVFRTKRTDVKCKAKFHEYALHHLIRQEEDSKILEMEHKFEQYSKQGKIPSCKERRAYNNAISSAEKSTLRDGADIILCTCNEAASYRMMDNIKPVYCIVDECAMATEPECMVPIRRAEHVVLIGDHMQLQPVIQCRDAASMGLNVSLFERYVKISQPHMLEVQYRMHPAICEFPSEEFYEGKLKTDRQVAKKLKEKVASLHHFWPQEGKPFAFCDVVGIEKEVHTGQKGKARVGLESKYNEEEGKKIVCITKVLCEIHKVATTEIAVLTPYSAQKAEIKKQMEKQGITGVEVKTITESQGSEFGIVLLSTVRSRKLEDICTKKGERKMADFGWKRDNLGFITNKHQICVGITRCKYGLVIVGNKMLLGYDVTWDHLIEHYHENGCITKESEFPFAE